MKGRSLLIPSGTVRIAHPIKKELMTPSRFARKMTMLSRLEGPVETKLYEQFHRE